MTEILREAGPEVGSVKCYVIPKISMVPCRAVMSMTFLFKLDWMRKNLVSGMY